MKEKEKFKKFMEIGYQKYQYGEYKEALNNFKQATLLSQQNDLIKDECIAIKMEATALYRIAKYQKAEKKYTLALDIAKDHGFKKQECRIYNHLIALHEMRNEYVKAKECIDKGYNLALELNDDLCLAKILNSKGVYFHIFGNDEDALKCYKMAMVYYEKSNDNRGVGTSCNLIAGYYYLLEDYDESLKCYQKANKIGKDLPDFDMLALSTCRIGLIHYKRKDKKKALEILKNPIFFEEKIENKKIVIEVYYVKGLIYKSLNQRENAKINFEEAIQLADSIGAKYLTARVYNELGIFFLEEGDIKTSYDNLKKCIDILNIIREKIDDENLRKQFKESFQDTLELIWLLSQIILELENNYGISELEYIKDTVLKLCKFNNNFSPDYAIKLQSKLITITIQEKLNSLKSEKADLIQDNIDIKKQRDLFEEENKKLKRDIKTLRSKLEDFQKKFEEIKKDPTKYTELSQKQLKGFINTTVWRESERQLINNYFNKYFSILNTSSKNELILMRTFLNIMESGYEICIFLLTKVVERELRAKIFKKFKNYYENLNIQQFCYKDNSSNYPEIDSYTLERIKKGKYRTNEALINYLDRHIPLELGKINYILREVNEYCLKQDKKIIYFEWERHFINLFTQEFCKFIDKILIGFETEIKSKKDSIQFIKLRNLVSHPDDIEEELINFKDIKFDEDFVETTLKFLTIDKPRLLKVICEIKSCP